MYRVRTLEAAEAVARILGRRKNRGPIIAFVTTGDQASRLTKAGATFCRISPKCKTKRKP